MIKVAVVCGLLHAGGKKNLIMEYYRHIDKSKVQFDWICDSDSNSIPYEEVKRLGGNVYVITPYKNLFTHCLQLWRIFKKNKYDIVHGYDNTLNVFSMMVAKAAGIKVRINESISMAHKGEWKTYIKLVLKPFSKIGATHFMANGDECGKWQFGEKAYNSGNVAIFKTVVDAKTNVYDPVLRDETRKKFGWTDNIVYGFIGRFEMQKNPLFMLDIFSEIAKIQKEAKLVIIGHGSMEQQMNEKIKSLGISSQVENLGKREDIKQFYNAFDAFLLPSLYEGLPVVGVESQACGLPIFFSTEIPQESSFCNLGQFISLDTPASQWAEQIINETAKNIPIRQSRTKELIASGYDSESESKKLQEYYIRLVKD